MADDSEGSKAVVYLREHGPTAKKELPVKSLSANVRRQIGTLRVTGGPGGGGSSMSVGGGLTHVAYLVEEHEFTRALRVWVNINSEAIERMNPNSLRRKLRGAGTREHQDVVSDVLDELGYEVDYSHRGGSHSTDFECPFCDESVSDLSSHLTKCEQKRS